MAAVPVHAGSTAAVSAVSAQNDAGIVQAGVDPASTKLTVSAEATGLHPDF